MRGEYEKMTKAAIALAAATGKSAEYMIQNIDMGETAFENYGDMMHIDIRLDRSYATRDHDGGQQDHCARCRDPGEAKADVQCAGHEAPERFLSPL